MLGDEDTGINTTINECEHQCTNYTLWKRSHFQKLQNLNAGFLFLFKDRRIRKGREEKCKGLRHVMELNTTHKGDDTDPDVAPQIYSSC